MDDAATGDNQIFISYSRSEMYYAEAIANRLQDNGFNAWFDLQQLEPGAYWQEDIQRGLEASNALVVIVSQASLQSSHVALEWEHAIANDYDIYLVLFEGVEFKQYTYIDNDDKEHIINTPDLLENANAIIDGRTHFKRMMKRLRAALSNEHSDKDAIPAPPRFGIPLKVPFAVNFVSFAMLTLLFVLLRLTLGALNESIPVAIGISILTGFTAYEWFNFSTRQSFTGMRNILLTATVLTLFVSPFILNQPEGDFGNISTIVFWLMVLFGIAWFTSINSLAFNRWSPRGEGTRRDVRGNRGLMRAPAGGFFRMYAEGQVIFKIIIVLMLFPISLFSSALVLMPFCPDCGSAMLVMTVTPPVALLGADWRYHRHKRKQQAEDDTPPTIYSLLYNVADEYVAQMVDNVMQQSGHQAVDASADVDFNVLLLSNFTQLEDFVAYLNTGKRRIILVISAIESRDWHDELGAYQWMDFRTHDRSQLVLLADELRHPEYDEVSLNLSARTTPQNFNKTLLPLYLRTLIITMLGIINLVAVLLAVSVASLLRQPIRTEDDTSAMSGLVILALMYLPFMIYSGHVITATIVRDVIPGRILNLAFVMISFPLLLSVLLGGFDISLILFAAILYFVFRWITRRWIGQWLPAISKEEKKAHPERVSRATWRRTQFNVLAISIVLITLALAFSLTNFNFLNIVQEALFL